MIMGPFETGKTRLLLCIVYMGHRGMPILDPSEASIFRTAEAWKGFLGIDEFWEISKEIERLLRASYKHGMKVPRIEKSRGGVLTLSLFDLFGKIVIASQEPFPNNILSKGILFQVRKMPDPNPEKRDPEPRDFQDVRTMGYIARLTWAQEVKSYADALDKQELGLSGREYEVWKPALTIASMIGGDVWKNVLAFAKESCEEKRRESYEELKDVTEAIYSVIQEAKGHFPLAFTPKQIHDTIWKRLKDEYSIVKEKQEISGHTSEQYDYDTRSFEKHYSAHRIGRTYLRQLGLRGKRKKRGTEYEIRSPLEFHDLVVRYHPDLQSQESDYSKLVLTSKLAPLLPQLQPKTELSLKQADLANGNPELNGINNATPKGNANSPSPEITPRKGSDGNNCNSCSISGIPDSSRGSSTSPAAQKQIEPKNDAVTYPTHPPEATDNCAVPPTPTRRRRKPLELVAVLSASLSKS
jgi:hypothetical protein